MLQELADGSDNQCLKMNKVMAENDTPIYVNNTQIENVGTEIEHQRQTQRKGDSKKKHGRMDSITILYKACRSHYVVCSDI